MRAPSTRDTIVYGSPMWASCALSRVTSKLGAKIDVLNAHQIACMGW
jgi:hypothetical protein